MLGLGNNLTHNKFAKGSEEVVDNFQSRVISDGGVFEAKECLINSIDNI